MKRITRFRDIPQFTQSASYGVDVSWDYLEKHLEHWKSEGRVAGVDLDPDFQRDHVWTKEQQTAYVEFVLRGGHSSRELLFNCKGWMRTFEGPFVLVDGKQRMTAARAFMKNEVPVFGGMVFGDFTDQLSVGGPSFRMSVNNLKTRAEVLQWYLELNTGGTIHTSDEIEKVRVMLAQEKK